MSEEKIEKDTIENDDSSKKLSDGSDPSFKWYVAHVLTGHENKVCKAINERIFNYGLEDSFSRIFIPEETVTTSVRGKKRSIKKKFFPGYILIKMIMNDTTWHLVRSTDKVTGFIGADRNKPTPITDEEASYMLGESGDGPQRPKASASFSEGDSVRVVEGPFTSFVGTVESVNDKGKVRVQVSIFGRPTPVELDFTQIEKV